MIAQALPVMARIVPSLCCAVWLALFAPPGLAGEQALRARALAATCANCHGTDGHAIAGASVLAGMPRQTLIERFEQFRLGQRPSTIMGQIAKGYTPEQLGLIAGYFAARAPLGQEPSR